jgi:hypothetical protein
MSEQGTTTTQTHEIWGNCDDCAQPETIKALYDAEGNPLTALCYDCCWKRLTDPRSGSSDEERLKIIAMRCSWVERSWKELNALGVPQRGDGGLPLDVADRVAWLGEEMGPLKRQLDQCARVRKQHYEQLVIARHQCRGLKAILDRLVSIWRPGSTTRDELEAEIAEIMEGTAG